MLPTRSAVSAVPASRSTATAFPPWRQTWEGRIQSSPGCRRALRRTAAHGCRWRFGFRGSCGSALPIGSGGFDPAPQDDCQFAAAQAFDLLKLQAGRGEPAAHRVIRKTKAEMRILLLEFGAVMLGKICLLYTSDAADERSSVDLGGR